MKNMKKTKSLCLIIVILTLFVNTAFSLTCAAGSESTIRYIPETVTTYARGVLMLNLDTDTVIYEKSGDRRMFPASLTKLTTAAVVLTECTDLENEKVTVPQDTSMFDEIYKVGGANISLKAGETMSVKDLLYALMLPSACDAASVLAYHFGNNSIDSFVAKMNALAKEIGMTNTNYENAHGLHSDNHYSSPNDIAKILAYDMKFPFFREIISNTKYVIPATNLSKARTVKYTIEMLDSSSPEYYPYMMGVKSGFTAKAGRCLASVAEKDGATYALILLGANLDQPAVSSTQKNLCYSDARTLYDYMFDNYELRTSASVEEPIVEIGVINGVEDKVSAFAAEEVTILVPKGTEITYKFDIPYNMVAPIEPGKVGTVKICCGDTVYASADMVIKDSIFVSSIGDPQSGNNDHSMTSGDPRAAIEKMGKLFENKTFLVLILLLLLFFMIFIGIIVYSVKKNRR